MAGLGRRTHYRKHLTDSVLNDLPEPTADQRIAKIVATRGGNQFEVRLPSGDAPLLAILPAKFSRLIWLKRGDYVLVEVADDQDAQGISCIITHVLYKEQLKHLKSRGLWPEDDPEFAVEVTESVERDEQQANNDGIVYDEVDDEELFVNTNRLANLAVDDSSSSSSDDEEK